MNVLVADDDRLIRYALQRTLSEAGHRVREARNGRYVMEAVADERPDVIVLDLMMPEVGGFEVLRWLREADPRCAIGVVILSGFIVESSGFEQYPHVIDVMQKPLVLDRLFSILESMSQRAAA